MTCYELVDFSKLDEVAVCKESHDPFLRFHNIHIIEIVFEISEEIRSDFDEDCENNSQQLSKYEFAPKDVYIYSFSLNPDNYQPSGTVNFYKNCTF
jgi:hypothetical protein